MENEATDKAAAEQTAAQETATQQTAAEQTAAQQAAAQQAADEKAAAAEKAADKTTTVDPATKAATEVGGTASGEAGAKKTDDASGNGKGSDAQVRRRSPESERIFTWLTVGQYFVLGVIGLIIVFYLFRGLLGDNTFLFALSKPEVARGVITFLVAAGTVSLAVLLVMAAIMSSGSQDLDHRFAFGKEVFTLLVGILGTIVGFYYGSTKENTVPLTLSPVAISEPTPAIGGKFTIDAMIIGGVSPYTYSIKFNAPTIIPDVIDQPSAGPIHQEFTIPNNKGATAGQIITFTIDIKDAKDAAFNYNKDGKQFITLKPEPAGAAATAAPTK